MTPERNEMNLSLKRILEQFPLRLSITDYCNLRCFFCSNEGMPLDKRNRTHMELSKFRYLVSTLADEGLRQISLTGGEPTLHPQLNEMLQFLKTQQIETKFFHTNGIKMSPKRISPDGFSKIAVSVHAFDRNIWSEITKGTEKQYQEMMDNLRELNDERYRRLVEIKHVIVKGVNDSPATLLKTLETCSKYGFKFKFLNFEPIEEHQKGLVVPISQVREALGGLGCIELSADREFRGQTGYLPINRYEFGQTTGVAIEIGCGDRSVCRECYNSNEIFISPGFEIKPCHAHPYTIGLEDCLKNQDKTVLLRSILESRRFLFGSPGQGFEFWRQTQK